MLSSTSYPGIKLSWTSTQAAYYHIYWATENDSSKAKKLTYSSSTSETIYASVYNLTSGTTYYFWIKSVNDSYSTDNTSDFSESVSFTFLRNIEIFKPKP